MERIEDIKNQCLDSISRAGDEFKNFPGRLKRLRTNEEENKIGVYLKQSELAEIVGLLPPNYSRIEKGNIAPSVGLLIALSEVFGVTIDYLIKGQHSAQEKAGEREPARVNNEPVEVVSNNASVIDELLKSKDQHIEVLNVLVRQLQDENKRLVSMAAK